MKAELGDYLMWEGRPAWICCIAEQRTVVIEMLEDRRCPHCGESLGKEQIHVIPTSPLFKECAKPIKSIG